MPSRGLTEPAPTAPNATAADSPAPHGKDWTGFVLRWMPCNSPKRWFRPGTQGRMTVGLTNTKPDLLVRGLVLLGSVTNREPTRGMEDAAVDERLHKPLLANRETWPNDRRVPGVA